MLNAASVIKPPDIAKSPRSQVTYTKVTYSNIFIDSPVFSISIGII